MNLNMKQNMKPDEIERASMEIIGREMGEWTGPEENLPVVKRVIHATADFEFAKNLFFSDGAVSKARAALKSGIAIITDTKMAASGISKIAASKWGIEIICRISDPDIADEARARGVTRAVVSMERAVETTPDAIFAIGNAPTALIKLCELIEQGRAHPALVVGVPVGFVNVIESKEYLRAVRPEVTQITAMGRKGGSTVAAAILNALLYRIA